MEKDLGSSFHYQHPEWKSSYLNLLHDPLIVAGQNSIPAYMHPCLNPAVGVSSLAAYSGVPLSKPSQDNAPFNWFYCLPRNMQVSASPLSSMPKDALVSEQMKYDTVNGSSKAEHNSGQSRFLVFDQSGDLTNLIYNCTVGTPVQYLTSWNPMPPAACDFTKEEFSFKRNAETQHSCTLDIAHDVENSGDLQSEMHEDTVEINALLYSDDEDAYSVDDEVTSTGHSPSTMTDHGIQQWPGDDQVASSASSFKRQKLLEGELIHKMNAEKPFSLLESEDDDESGCLNFVDQVQGKPFTGKKRLRNDKIRETVSILSSIIPGAKGNDALVVIDKAIDYLKSLKVKVQSEGLEAL